MYAYCVAELGFSEDAACKRIAAARAARRFPVIFAMVEDGRQHLTGLVTLVPHLLATDMVETKAEELLTASAGKTRKTIEQLLAERFPRPDVPTLLEPLSPAVATTSSGNPSAPGRITPQGDLLRSQTEPVTFSSPGPPTLGTMPSRITPLAPQRFKLQTTIDDELEALVREAQELLGQPGSSQIPEVLKILARLGIEHLRKKKFGATDSPRAGREHDPQSRHIPNEVRRAVWARDGGQCTFVRTDGRRCQERSSLEFDHIEPYARGGMPTVHNIRLLCAAHNQLEAERTYGVEFMRHKREAS
jgi:hypothetical protein